MSLNKILLIGRAGNDPDVRAVGENKAARISLATTERRKDRNGEFVEETTWHTVQVWGKTAEFVEGHVRKGSQLFVEGRIRNRKYTDQTGADKYVTEVVADSVQLLDPRRSDDGQESRQQRPARPSFVPNPQQRPVRGQAPVDDLPPDYDPDLGF